MIIIFPIKIVGKKNLKKLKGQNYILACNHTSNLDPVMLIVKLRKHFKLVAKKELFKNKFASFFLRQYGAIPIDRSQADTAAIKEILSALNKKHSLIIFPQGTRAEYVNITDGEAKEGVAMFSIRTNTPVLPVVFNKKIKAFKRTKLLIGEPIYPDPEKKKDKQYLADFSDEIVNKMNQLLEGEYTHENERF